MYPVTLWLCCNTRALVTLSSDMTPFIWSEKKGCLWTQLCTLLMFHLFFFFLEGPIANTRVSQDQSAEADPSSLLVNAYPPREFCIPLMRRVFTQIYQHSFIGGWWGICIVMGSGAGSAQRCHVCVPAKELQMHQLRHKMEDLDRVHCFPPGEEGMKGKQKSQIGKKPSRHCCVIKDQVWAIVGGLHSSHSGVASKCRL